MRLDLSNFRMIVIALALGLAGCAAKQSTPDARPTVGTANSATTGQPVSDTLNASEAQAVILAILIKADGSVGDVKVEKSSGLQEFDDRAVDIYRNKVKYIPGTKDGKNVDSWKLIRVVWKMKE